MTNVLTIFLDESGNLDFSPKGTANFVLAAITALQPLHSSIELQKLKYNLLVAGEDVQHFHASEDKQMVRDAVFQVINGLTNIQINYIHAEKCKAHPSVQTTADFYGLLGKTLLTYLLKGYQASQFDQVVIIFDKALSKKDQNQFLKMVKPQLKALGKPYRIYFHHTLSDFNGQIADYAAWAKYVSLERAENRPINALNNIKMTSFDIFQSGSTKYY
jgi:hypothetical protein